MDEKVHTKGPFTFHKVGDGWYFFARGGGHAKQMALRRVGPNINGL